MWAEVANANLLRYTVPKDEERCSVNKPTYKHVAANVAPVPDHTLAEHGMTKLHSLTLDPAGDVSLWVDALRRYIEGNEVVRKRLHITGKFCIIHCVERRENSEARSQRPVDRVHIDLMKFPIQTFLDQYLIRRGLEEKLASELPHLDAISTDRSAYLLLNVWVHMAGDTSTLALMSRHDGIVQRSYAVHPKKEAKTYSWAVSQDDGDKWFYWPRMRPGDAWAFLTAATPHTSIPLDGNDPRRSVEFRLLVERDSNMVPIEADCPNTER